MKTSYKSLLLLAALIIASPAMAQQKEFNCEFGERTDAKRVAKEIKEELGISSSEAKAKATMFQFYGIDLRPVKRSEGHYMITPDHEEVWFSGSYKPYKDDSPLQVSVVIVRDEEKFAEQGFYLAHFIISKDLFLDEDGNWANVHEVMDFDNIEGAFPVYRHPRRQRTPSITLAVDGRTRFLRCLYLQ